MGPGLSSLAAKLLARLPVRARLILAFCFFGVVPMAVMGGSEALHPFVSTTVLTLLLSGGVLALALALGIAFTRHVTRMVTHLQEQEGQLREERERAERRAQEAQALYRIGTEILALNPLPQVLQLVVDKARELIKGDVAILCLYEPGVGLRVGATSGPPEAFFLKPEELVGVMECTKVTSPEAICPVVQGVTLPTHIAVPIQSGERIIGDLCVGYLVARPVGREERGFLEGLSKLAAITIENARLHWEVRALAALEERERIAVDLHDGVIQSIYATGLGLEECVRLTEEDPQEIKSRLEVAIENLNVVIRDVRNYIIGLQAEGLKERGLSRSLADFTRELALNTLLDPELDIDQEIEGALTLEQTGHLFQICREALTNVVKHSGASRVMINLRKVNGIHHLIVDDNGRGFDATSRPVQGRGLHTMEERARRLGGSMGIESGTDRGTRITIEFPSGKAA